MSTLFWKTTAGILVAVVLILAVEKQRDLALMLSMATCVMVGLAALSLLEPVLDFLYRMTEFIDIQQDLIGVLTKATGVGLVCELVQLICRDSGNAALAQMTQLLGTGMIMLLSLPVLESLLDLVQQILGEL